MLFSRQQKLETPETKWYMYFDASKHTCNTINSFSTLHNSPQERVEIGDWETLNVEGMGTVNDTVFLFWSRENVQFRDVLYVPKLNFNLLSVITIRKMKYSFLFIDDLKGNGICKVIQQANNEFFISWNRTP